LRRYDPVRFSEGMDWKSLYQSRNWAAQVIKKSKNDIDVDALHEEIDRSTWKVSGQDLLYVLRDMIVENG